jgi:demethylmenaquinone methyltransferase/2-methoxy-6-polyprenyl-1,4-benzoquinol methylase
MSESRPLQRMFMAVPPRYDLINKIFTLGMDKKWRDKATVKCLSAEPEVFLDLCCGTGDLAINVAKKSTKKIEVLGIDYSLPMLKLAVEKAKYLAVGNSVNILQGDASALPFAGESLDCIGISFAFRNLTYKNPLSKKHLSEVLRVLKEGGRYVILESSQPQCGFMRALFRVYLRTIVFWAGYIISGNKGAYRYLSESAANFYNSSQVREMLLTSGFSEVEYIPLFWGAAGIHVASK